MKTVLSLVFCSIIFSQVFSQSVAINNDGSQPNAGAILDIKSTNKGLLIPRVNLTSETDVSTIPSPVNSLLVFNTNAALPDGVGFYFWNGNNKWSKLATVNAANNISWGLGGNNNTSPATDFIGTTDNQPLIFKTNNVLSGKIAQGITSVFFGQHAGENTTGTDNSFFGDHAGSANTTGFSNIAIGSGSLNSNTSGFRNIGLGYHVLYSNTTGSDNIANGYVALFSNTSGTKNTAIGYEAMYSNTTGDRNLGLGYQALYANTTGFHNTGIGHNALDANTDGDYNTAIGSFAMKDNTTGDFNVAIGNNALDDNLTGNNNTSIGSSSGPIPTYPDLENTTCIGYAAQVRESNAISFGNTLVQKWLFGNNTISAGLALKVGSTATNGNGAYLTQGGTWTNTSSRIKKEEFSDINATNLLQKIKSLSIKKWKYKGTDEYHIGPVSEDFYALFGLGADDQGISTVDPSGIALAGMKELILINEKQYKLIENLQERIEALERK